MKNYKNLRERLNSINKKGIGGMDLAWTLIGVYIAIQVVVIFLPDMINNLTGLTIGGSFGGLFTTILPLILLVGIFMYFSKSMGLQKGK